MSVFLSPVGGAGAQFFDNNGSPLSGGKLYTYSAGTTTPQTTYTSSSGAIANSNPIVFDAAGRVPGSSEIWLSSGVSYKFVLKTSNDVLLGTWDNITPSGDPSFSQYTPASTSLLYPGPLTVKSALDQITNEESGSSLIGYRLDKTGAVERTVSSRLMDVVSVFDFLPDAQVQAIIDNNEAGQNATIVTAGINAAIAASNAVYFPMGTYMINGVIGDSGTNPISRTIYGEDQQKTIIKSVSGWTSSGMVWFGNSSGYGAQYCTIRNLTIDGNAKANNHSGIVYQSAGLSLVQNVTIKNCGRAAWMHGCIDTAMIDCNIFSCFEGAYWDVYPIGTPSGPRDMSVQANQTTRANISRMYGCWISDCEATSVYISGGSFLLDACTFQSTTNNQAYNIIHVVNSNESYDYGGGPIVQNCWQEGGSYKYFLYVENTRQIRVFNNHINGDFGAGTTVEGAIFLDAASVRNVSIKNNSIRGNYSATPTGGRLANAAIYVTGSDYTYTADIENNYITTNTVNVYWADLASPTVDRKMLALFGSISISAGVGTVTFQSMKFILSIAKNGTGDFTVTYTFNRQSLASGFYPVTVTPHTIGGAVTYSVSHLASSTQADRFIFNDDSGSPADPAGFTIQLLGGGWVQI